MGTPPNKKVIALRVLITGALVLSGWLTGGTVDRFVVQFPAWRHIAISQWAAFSRHADMGNGLFLYPFEAIGSFILLLAAAVIILQSKPYLRTVALPVYCAVVFAALGLFFTIYAAPVMLSIRTENDPLFLQHAFDSFYFWSAYRVIVQVLSFFCCIWAMARASGIKWVVIAK